MLLLTFVEREISKRTGIPEKACISWTRDGKAFIIRNREELVNNYVPRIFHIHKAKFASFTRKLYRWGFRQVILRAKDDRRTTENDKIFVHEDFQRDNKQLLANMKSITAEGTRRAYSSMVVGVHSEESSPIQYHRKLIEEIGHSSLKRPSLPSALPSMHRQDVLLNSLPMAPSMASSGSYLSGFPLFTGIVEHQPSLTTSLLSSAAGRQGRTFNHAFRSPYPMEPLLHPVVHSALLMGRQRQQADDVARARQYLATLLEQQSQRPNAFL
jgi:hypothetical protein